MYQEGDYVIYGNHGVCRIEKIGPMDLRGISKERQYYTLVPVYSKDSALFTPVDSEKVLMRPIMTKDEALALIDAMDSMEFLGGKENAKREDIYKDALRSGDPKEWIRIIKTLNDKGQKRLEQGKKNTVGDERYLRMAEESLLGEMAASLGMERDQVKDFILSRTVITTEK